MTKIITKADARKKLKQRLNKASIRKQGIFCLVAFRKKGGKQEFGLGIGSDVCDLDIIIDRNNKIVPCRKLYDFNVLCFERFDFQYE